MAVFTTTFSVSSRQPTELVDITAQVNDAVRMSSLKAGIACVNTCHTTAVVFIDESHGGFLDDLLALAERLVPQHADYRHNDPRYSDCERGNAQAHLRAAIFGRGVAVGVSDSQVMLGGYQSIIFAEFDGPRTREVSVQIAGE
jgi:secondary thiamine-phosphate synthase enzyme